MAQKRVVAYWMNRNEEEQALSLLSAPQATESFAVGDIDEDDIPRARAAGLVIQEQRPASEPEPAPELRLRDASRSFGFEALGEPLFASAGSSDRIPAEVDYYRLGLDGPLFDEQREQLVQAGVTFVQALPEGGYKVRLRNTDVPNVAALEGVSIRPIGPESAAPAAIAMGAAPGPDQPPRMLAFDVRLNVPEARATVQQWLENQQITVAGSSARKIRIYALANAQALIDVLNLPDVASVDEYIPPTLFSDAARRLLGVDVATASLPAPGVALDGSGEVIAIADGGIDAGHPDFAGRIRAVFARGRPGDASDPQGHGTHVAGCALGDGTASGGLVKGVAPKAELVFQSLLDARGNLGGLPVDLNDLFLEAYGADARIHNCSWGNCDSKSRYMVNSEEVDEFVYAHPDMLVVIAGGNDGSAAATVKSAPGYVDWLSIAAPGTCKNALTVGASRSDRADGPYSQHTWGMAFPRAFPAAPMAAERVSGDPQCLAGFSSRGPTDDRRIKPDVVAPGTDIASTRSSLAPLSKFWGQYPATPGAPVNAYYAFDGGTSMAAPFVAGCAAVVRQYFRTQRNHKPSAALLKATLVNSTVWLTGVDSTAPLAGTPNWHQGHGRVDLANAIPNVGRPGLVLEFSDDWTTGSGLAQLGSAAGFQITVPAGCPDFRACLAYTDLPMRGLQNNLNLIVQRGGDPRKYLGNEAIPDALTLPDVANNLESVRIPNPAPGMYYIKVVASNLFKGPQAFALAVTGDGLSGFARYT